MIVRSSPWLILLCSALGCESFELAREQGSGGDAVTDASADVVDSAAATDVGVDTGLTDSVTPDTVPPTDSFVPPVDSGCKCGDPGCCPGVAPIDCCAGATCPVKHDTGLGPTYWFCGPLGVPGNPSTYTKDMALKASAAWRAAGTASEIACGSASTVVNNPPVTSDPYGLWTYSGTNAGRVRAIVGGVTCPDGTSKTWD